MAKHRAPRVPAVIVPIAGVWAILLSMFFFVAARPAEAATITPNLPTMRITLTDPDPTHNTLSYVCLLYTSRCV